MNGKNSLAHKSLLPVVEEDRRTKRQRYEDETRQALEKIAPEKWDPSFTALGNVRAERTLKLLQSISVGSSLLDLGCGSGYFAAQLGKKGATVTAIDVVEKQIYQHEQVSFQYACLPYLHTLRDAAYDGILFTDVIAEIDPAFYRLTISEIARLTKGQGWVLVSTPLDLGSEDAHEKFTQLLQTEFDIMETCESYHRLYIFLLRCLKAPFRFYRMGNDAGYRLEHLNKRSALLRIWFFANSTPVLSLVWKRIARVLIPFFVWVQKSRKLLLFLERISETLWGAGALTHIIVLARKKKI